MLKISEKCRKKGKNKIIKSKLSKKKISDFEKEILVAIDNTSTIEPILKKFNIIVHEKDDSEKIDYFGIIRRLYKAYFIDDILFSYWRANGAEYGRIMAESKDEEIIQEFLKNNQHKTVDKNENPVKLIDEHFNDMKNKGYSPNLIITPFEFVKQLYGDNFIPIMKIRDDYDINNLLGTYNGILTIGFRKEVLGNNIFIIDLEKACKLIQIKNLSVDIHILNEDDKTQIQKQNVNISAKELDLEVLLEIKEKFEFKVMDSNAILKLEDFKDYSFYKSRTEYMTEKNNEDK